MTTSFFSSVPIIPARDTTASAAFAVTDLDGNLVTFFESAEEGS